MLFVFQCSTQTRSLEWKALFWLQIRIYHPFVTWTWNRESVWTKICRETFFFYQKMCTYVQELNEKSKTSDDLTHSALSKYFVFVNRFKTTVRINRNTQNHNRKTNKIERKNTVNKLNTISLARSHFRCNRNRLATVRVCLFSKYCIR